MEPNQQTPPNPGPQQNEVAENAAQKRKPVFDPTGRIEGLTPDETLVFDVRQHLIGLVFIYTQTAVAITLSLGLVIFFLPSVIEVLGFSESTVNSLAALFTLGVIALGLLFLVLATRIYKGNQLIASDKNVTQVIQVGLFNRKISELAMANIEDVTARQSGILPTAFNYGTLHIETAGEQNNFIFAYCPNPNAYAKAILDARIGFITEHGE